MVLLLLACRIPTPDTADSGCVTSTWYADADGDGHGGAAATEEACDAAAGWVASDDDCDDALASVYPGAPEYCNTIDDDCDGSVDEDAVDAPIWYVDGDGDGFGAPVTACEAPEDQVSDATDCDDADADVHPGAAEIAGNRADEDCDGRVDELLVCADGTGDFVTVQEGVDGTPDGGTIEVCPGSYDEAVAISDRVLTIVGGGERASDVVFSYADYYALYITGAATDITIQNVSFAYALLGGNAPGNVAFDGVDFCTNNVGGSVHVYFPYGGSSFSVERSYFCPAGSTFLYSSAAVVRFQENAVEMAGGSWMTLDLQGAETRISNNLITGGTFTMRFNSIPSSSYTDVFNNTFADGDALTIAVQEFSRVTWDAFKFHKNIVVNMADSSARMFELAYDNHATTPDCSIYVPNPFEPNASWNLAEGWLTCQGFDSTPDHLDPVYSEAQAGLFSAGFTKEDPMFISAPGMGDYALDPASPCVDAGSGDRDPDGSRADLGAFGGADGDWWEQVPWLE